MIRIAKFERRIKADGTPDDWVLFSSIAAVDDVGNLAHATWERVRKLKPAGPDTEPVGTKTWTMHRIWEHIEPAYEAWLEGQTMPETGTPLAAWPGANEAAIAALARFEVKTVEALAELPETVVQKLPLPDPRGLQKAARLWLEGRTGAEAADKIADLEAKLAAALELLESKQAEEAEDKPEEPKKRGPGRPRKEEAA